MSAATYEVPHYKARLVCEGVHTYPTTKCHRPEDVTEVVRPLLAGLDREHMVAVYLDAKNAIRGVETIAIGSLSQCAITPAQIFRGAIVAAAAGIVLVHNHPSGDPTPSGADIALTREMVKVGRMLGVQLVDHIIYADAGGEQIVSLHSAELVNFEEAA